MQYESAIKYKAIYMTAVDHGERYKVYHYIPLLMRSKLYNAKLLVFVTSSFWHLVILKYDTFWSMLYTKLILTVYHDYHLQYSSD